MRGVRASGRGEAASACKVQRVPPGPGSAVGSSAPVRGLFANPGRGMLGLSSQMGPNL